MLKVKDGCEKIYKVTEETETVKGVTKQAQKLFKISVGQTDALLLEHFRLQSSGRPSLYKCSVY